MNRFAEAMKTAEKEENIVEDLLTSSMDLCKEIAERGARGEKISETEQRFMKATTLFMLHGLVSSMRK